MTSGAVIVTYSPQLNDLNILISNITASVKQIVLVDNGSNNLNEIKQLLSHFKNAVLIPLGSNKGIGFAQNRGIEHLLKDKEIEGVVLFDHDSHPEADMINILSNECERMQKEGIKIGAVGPVYVDPRTKNNYPISVFAGFRLIKKYPVQGNNDPISASFLIASGSLIPRSTIEAVGYMNEGFFIDYIDIEWSFRATSKGFHSYACPAAKMYHQVGDDRFVVLGREISIHTPLRRYYLARNSVLMLKIKYISWKYKVREICYSFSRVFVFLFFIKKRSMYMKYIIRGWYDGIIGKVGSAGFIEKAD